MMAGLTLDPTGWGDLVLRTGLKGAVLLTGVALLALALTRASAAARHLVWFLGTVAVLALPALEAGAPDWRVPLPGGLGRVVEVVTGRGAPGPALRPAPAAVAPGREVLASTRAGSGGSVAHQAARSPLPETGGSGAQGVVERAEPAAADRGWEGSGAPRELPGSGETRTATLAGARPDVGLLLGLGWAAGALLLLGGLVRSALAVRRMERTAEPFPRGRVTRLAAEMAAHLDVGRPVRFLRGGPGDMPLSFGIRRPAVLLPEGAERWHASRLVAVLLHELAHVRRRDSLTQTLAEVARALHWFDPLVWIAVRRLRVEREHACDDRVLAAGARPSEYAEELLSLARGFCLPRRSGRAAVAMAGRGDLGDRLRRVLAEGRPRLLSPRGAAYAVAAVALLVLPLAGLTPVPAGGTVGSAEAAAPGSVGLETTVPARRLAPPPAREPVVARTAPLQATTCGMAATGWESTSHNSSNDRHRLEWRRDGCEVEVRIEGVVEFTPDFRDIARLGSGALLRIEEEDDRTERRLDVTPGPAGAPSYEYRVDGREQAFDAGARTWFEGMLLQVFRRGGFMAGERVQALLDRGGVDAVFEELEMLHSDHVFSRYVEELLARAELEEGQVVDVLDRARRRVDSDHYLAGILEAAARGRPFTIRILDATLEASRELDSDHYRAGVLARALERGDLDAGRAGALLSSASEIESDHYLAALLTDVAERYALQPELRGDYLRASRSIESDHYRAEVLTALLARNDLTDQELGEVVAAARDIESDHYKTRILGRVTRDGLPAGPVQDAYFEVAASIESDHYFREALRPLIRGEGLSGELLVRVLEAAARMDGDHYKADVLVEIAEGHPLQGRARTAFMDALESIDSRHYRGVVSEAFLRAGG